MEFHCILEGIYEGTETTIFYVTIQTPFKDIEGVELVTDSDLLEAELKRYSKGYKFVVIGRPARKNGAIRLKGDYARGF